MDRVVLYTQADCPGCENVARFLEGNGVSYVEKDIGTDEAALVEFQRMGYPATPLTVVGEHQVLGFNRRALRRALGLAAPG